MNALKSIKISNYKCFNCVSFNVKAMNILIGENNAGKSTAIEAIKLISLGVEKLKIGGFIDCPVEVSEYLTHKCVKLNIDNKEIDISVASHKYNGKPSYITGYFENRSFVIITIFNSEAYAIAYDETKNCLISKSAVKKNNFPTIFVMPHFGLLREKESPISEERTKHDRFKKRSSLHFRNELYNSDLDDILALNQLLNETWHGLRVDVSYKLFEDEYISLMVRDKDFSAEIKDYGSGLQMWLQILWFLCKIEGDNCVIVLDEPDVYIHADLQRKLYRIVADRYPQIIIATHSVEIINEANLSDILIVDKLQSSFRFCREKATLERALKNIGTTQNLMLTKLQRHNKCLFVEGEDLEIIDSLFKVVIRDPSKSVKDFATGRLNGKSNYKESFGASKILKEDTDGTFKVFCILDKDFNDEYNKQIEDEAKQNGIVLYILQRLEIENYLIIPRIFAELIDRDIDFVNKKIMDLAQTLKGETFDRILQEKVAEYRKIYPQKNMAEISRETREFIDANWSSIENIISIVPGKELKGKIFNWLKDDFGISCNDKKILKKVQLSDIPSDMIEFLHELNN